MSGMANVFCEEHCTKRCWVAQSPPYWLDCDQRGRQRRETP